MDDVAGSIQLIQSVTGDVSFTACWVIIIIYYQVLDILSCCIHIALHSFSIYPQWKAISVSYNTHCNLIGSKYHIDIAIIFNIINYRLIFFTSVTDIRDVKE